MEGKHYRWLWWIAAILLLAGIIWYAAARNQSEEYTDGTLVWSPADVFCMNNRNYCHLASIPQPPSDREGGGHLCQRLYI